MIGHVVIGLGPGYDGNDSVAVWHVSPDGLNTGAWLLSPGSASHLPVLCAGRAIAAWDPPHTVELLRERTGFEPPEWEATYVAIPLIVKEIRSTRRSYEDCVKRVKWATKIPDPLPKDPAGFRRAVGLRLQEDACASARDALATAGMVSWAVRAWRDTASVWKDTAALPSDWERRLVKAQE